MTENEWVSCYVLESMLEFIIEKQKPSHRKLQLFLLACCRVNWHLLDQQHRNSVDAGELLADGVVSRTGLEIPCRPLADGISRTNIAVNFALTPFPLDSSLARRVAAGANFAWEASASASGEIVSVWYTLKKRQVFLFRDIVANPFRPTQVAPSWLSWNNGTVVRLAQAAYDDRRLPEGHLDPARLAVLADALEEAGCAEAELLEHLRGVGPHVRGCWPVDLLLGKE